ncbi:hypothetical protein V8E51_018419 [Hyaloscypha variabilis]
MKTPIAKWIQGIAIVSNACRFAVLADTTTSFSPSCIPGSPQTAFPNCDHFLNFGNTCPYLSTDQAREECLCNQDYVNSLFGCESEMRVCYEGDSLDDDYQSALSSWHSLCDTFLPSTLTVTTPPLSQITENYLATCQAEQDACSTMQLLQDNCDNSFTEANAAYTSCLCQPRWLSLDYTCEFEGNRSCLGVPATLSNMIGYDCPNFQDVIGTGLPASGSVITLSGPTSSAAITPSPSRTAMTASQTATTTKSSEGAHRGAHRWLLGLLCPSFWALYIAVT